MGDDKSMAETSIGKEELKKILRELKSESDVVKLEQKARYALKQIDPKTLSIAEQELLEEGFSQEDLRKLCDVHLQLLGENLEKGPSSDEGHPISILTEEHKIIKRSLDTLEHVTQNILTAKDYGEIQSELVNLRESSELLLETESHHKREEEALFPALEKHGISGPPRIMRMEHDELRARKKALGDLVERHHGMEFDEFKAKLKETSDFIVAKLRDHIFKEDNILYPTSTKTLGDEEWEEVRRSFDAIGYCCFTPRRKDRGLVSE